MASKPSNKGFFTWRGAVLRSGLPPTTRHLLLTLSCHMNDAGESCYPSVARLMEETGLSKQTVITHLNIAVEEGWIQASKHGYGDRRWARNEYRISLPEAVKEIDHDTNMVVKQIDHDGGQAVRPPDEQGGQSVERGGQPSIHEVVKEVDPSTSVNSSSNSPVTSCAEPLRDSTPAFIHLPLVGGQTYRVTQTQIAFWKGLYPAVDVEQQLRAMLGWLDANSNRRKTKSGITRFVNNWLSREQNRGGVRHETNRPTDAVSKVRQANAERERRHAERRTDGQAVGADGRNVRPPLDI